MGIIKNLRAAVALSLLATAAGAHAETVYLKDAASQPLVVTTSIYIAGIDLNGAETGGLYTGQVNNVQIGQYQLDQQTPAGSFGAYCVDPFQLSSGSFQPYSRSSLTSANLPSVQAARFGEVTKLYANAYAGSLMSSGPLSANTMSAGFQIALWEVWHDDKNLLTGNIRSSGISDSGSVTEAQRLLGLLSGWTASTTPALSLYHSDSYQDYVVPASEPGSVSPAPEPGTYALLLAGFGILGLARRRQA